MSHLAVPDLPGTFASSGSISSFRPPAAAIDTNGVQGGLQHIDVLAHSMSEQLRKAIREIDDINLQTRILAFNAQIEAARAGTQGAAFGVVASEMVRLSQNTTATATTMGAETNRSISEMTRLIGEVGAAMRGTRLSDLALTNIELVDRNLYERSCDVRWWATDSSVVDALEKEDEATRRFTCKRLGVILDSYTVYYDLVVCDLKGQVVANGRPDRYGSIGSNQSTTTWFQAALGTRDGTQFGFQSVHRSSSLAGGEFILVYSCAIREEGKVNGRPIGVLGIVFNWESLAQTIVRNTQISAAEKSCTRVCMVDDTGLVLADTANKLVTEKLTLPDQSNLFRQKKSFCTVSYQGRPHIIAHALSPGFETYATGWHSLVIQPVTLGH